MRGILPVSEIELLAVQPVFFGILVPPNPLILSTKRIIIEQCQFSYCIQ
jgi:hypothetical protein